MGARLPVWIARCAPSMACLQADRCARFLAEADDSHDEIDASRCVDHRGCALFVDQRALPLLQATALHVATATEQTSENLSRAHETDPTARDPA